MRKYINLLAYGMITHEEYQDSIEANNKELTDLMKQKNELLTFLESEDVTKTITSLSQF